MSGYLIPSESVISELWRTHERTFAIEPRDDRPFILFLKLTPTQILSVINGAPMELVIESPAAHPNTITFKLNDVIGSSFWISREFAPHEEGELFGLPQISKQLAEASHLQIALIDWNTRCVHTETALISKPQESLEEWTARSRRARTPRPGDGAALDPGYILKIAPLATRPNFLYQNISFQENVGDRPYLVSTNKYSDRLYTSAYIGEGKHGYYQEYVLAFELAKDFRAGSSLFISPRTRDEAELTDLLIAAHGAIVLIESKASSPYAGSPRQPDAVEKSLTRLVRKAFEQLYLARRIVIEDPELLEDSLLSHHCKQATAFVSLCVVDDAFMINPRSLRTSLDQWSDTNTEMGTFILDIEDFYGLLARSRSTFELVSHLVRLSENIPPYPDVPLFKLGF